MQRNEDAAQQLELLNVGLRRENAERLRDAARRLDRSVSSLAREFVADGLKRLRLDRAAM
jgi:cell division protein ZapA (FtsZ GTPase activity inhibitor)